MNNRTNKLLIGVIMLLVGFISLIQHRIGINYAGIAITGAGFAFLLLYKTKRKIWSLLLGLSLFSAGVINLLSPFVPSSIMALMTAAMCFWMPGIIFIILFYQRNKAAFLVPGSLLSWFGLYILLAGLPFFHKTAFGLFFLCIGMAFFMIYMLGKDFLGKFPQYIGFILCFAGLVSMSGLFPGIGLIRKIPGIGSIMLISVSIYIIVKALRKE